MELRFSVCLVQLFSALAVAEVTVFSNCTQFFANPGGTPVYPTIRQGNQYKQICQKLYNQYRYATLYDTSNLIPVFSAYEYAGTKTCDRTEKWYIEPQLDDNNGGTEMGPESLINKDIRGRNQALSKDYKGSGYNRGHLYPVSQNDDQCFVDATFTLTNAAPQNSSFNQGKWGVIESKIINTLSNSCKNMASYIVTGVVPGNSSINGRVNIPSYFWSAYCCLDNNKKVTRSGGYISPNNNNDESVTNEISVKDLDKKLKTYYGVAFSVFGGKC